MIRLPRNYNLAVATSCFSGFRSLAVFQPIIVVQGRSTRSPSLEDAVALLKLYNYSQLIHDSIMGERSRFFP